MLAQNSASTTPQADEATATRIAVLTNVLLAQDGNTGGVEWERERERVTSEIRAEVTRFIESSVSPSETPETAEARLRSVLATHVPGSEYSDPPTVRMADLQYGRSLVSAYIIVRPLHFDSALISGFKEDAGRFRLVANTGRDFEGYTLFTHKVSSPIRNQLWLLAGGRAFTFNGSKFRFRLYSFDGSDFTTVWSPDDVFNAELKLLPDGFAVTHYLRGTHETVTEQYQATANGLVRIR